MRMAAESRSGASRWAERRWLEAKSNPEAVATLVMSLVAGTLAFAGALSDPSKIAGWTLAVLALVSFSLLGETRRRLSVEQEMKGVRTELARVADELRVVDERVGLGQAVAAVPAGQPIRAAFEAALRTTGTWRFRGGTGSFLRAWTLPHMADAARERGAGRTLTVSIVVLDPSDAVCEEYSAYRQKLARGRADEPPELWTPDRVRAEAAASVVAAVWYRQHEYLDVELGLSRAVSVLRYDIASDLAILTNEDREIPALLVRSESPLYKAFVSEVQQSVTRGRVRVEQARDLPPRAEDVGVEESLGALEDLGIRLDGVPDEVLADLPSLAFKRRDPYGHDRRRAAV